ERELEELSLVGFLRLREAVVGDEPVEDLPDGERQVLAVLLEDGLDLREDDRLPRGAPPRRGDEAARALPRGMLQISRSSSLAVISGLAPALQTRRSHSSPSPSSPSRRLSRGAREVCRPKHD